MLVHPAEARRRFRQFAAGEISSANLARGALLIALEDHPKVDLDACLRRLDDLAERVERRCGQGEPTVFRLGHLQSEMFEIDGYRGDAVNFYDPRNAYLHEVIERRRGLPIALSIVFLHVASRVGLHASGVGLPAHYIVKVRFDMSEVYVDPFDGGTTLTVAEIASLLSQMSARRVELSPSHLRAWSGRETLMRVLANLQNMWTMAGDRRKADAAAERITILQSYA